LAAAPIDGAGPHAINVRAPLAALSASIGRAFAGTGDDRVPRRGNSGRSFECERLGPAPDASDGQASVNPASMSGRTKGGTAMFHTASD
jgi:hypothetical protein